MSGHMSSTETTTTSKALESFITDCIVRQLSQNTITSYRRILGQFTDWSKDAVMEQVDTALLRDYIRELQETGHNPGGVHLHYRYLRTFLLWYELETDGGYRSPTHKVKAPKVNREPLEPVSMEHVKALLKTCDRTLLDIRDRALITILVDTGARARELMHAEIEQVDVTMGSIRVLGKGSKTRTLYLGTKARRALYQWNRVRPDSPYLFTNKQGDRLGYDGLVKMLNKRAKMAGIPKPKTHAFRRCYALSMLRAGTDIFTLAKLLGHSNTRTLEHYIKLDCSDMEQAQRVNSVADRL